MTCRACGMLLWLTTKMILSPRRFHSCGRFLHKGSHQRRVEPCEFRVHLHAERRHGQGLQETESRSEHRHLDLFKITQHFPQFPQFFLDRSFHQIFQLERSFCAPFGSDSHLCRERTSTEGRCSRTLVNLAAIR